MLALKRVKIKMKSDAIKDKIKNATMRTRLSSPRGIKNGMIKITV